jgi:N-acetylmuramoyl-L-alanine amidase
MKSGLYLLTAALALSASALAAHQPTRASAPAASARGGYVRLTDWAESNGFELRWTKREHSFQLVGPVAKARLAVDSREAQVNGVNVWLSFPVAVREGVPCLAQIDIQTVLHPLLSPAKSRSGGTLKSVCLDPGHGGKDPGNKVGPYVEKKYTLLLAQEVERQLTRAGLKVCQTRTTDTFIDLGERPEIAKRNNADLFVSLHFNSAESSRTVVRGAEVYCMTPAGASSTNARGEGGGAGSFPGNRFNDKNLYLAYQVQKALTRNLSVEDRGVKRARFVVLRDATMPAVLIEAGFMSHPDEGKRIFDVGYRRQMAGAVVDGILAYKKSVEQRGWAAP